MPGLTNQVNTIPATDDGLMLGRRRRRRPNIKPSLIKYCVSKDERRADRRCEANMDDDPINCPMSIHA